MEDIASVDVTDRLVLSEGEMLEVAECLFEAMEKLDPTVPEKPIWDEMDGGEKEFYRYCAKTVLNSAGQVAARRPAATK